MKAQGLLVVLIYPLYNPQKSIPTANATELQAPPGRAKACDRCDRDKMQLGKSTRQCGNRDLKLLLKAIETGPSAWYCQLIRRTKYIDEL